MNRYYIKIEEVHNVVVEVVAKDHIDAFGALPSYENRKGLARVYSHDTVNAEIIDEDHNGSTK